MRSRIDELLDLTANPDTSAVELLQRARRLVISLQLRQANLDMREELTHGVLDLESVRDRVKDLVGDLWAAGVEGEDFSRELDQKRAVGVSWEKGPLKAGPS